MKIIVDAFGGDYAPLEILKGATKAVEELNVDILLTGKADIIKNTAKENGMNLSHMEILDCPDVMPMEDPGTEILKKWKNSSMAVGLCALAEGKGDAFVSAGNSGALTVGATFLVKRIHGIKRIGFAPVIPDGKGCFMLMDGGANADCKPEMLYQFGLMGALYMKKVMQIENPTVGLLNVGTEEHKGSSLQQEAYALLKNSNLNFVGNVEARSVNGHACDVLVADGFSGNVFLKTYEGTAMMVMGKLKEVLQKNPKTKLAAGLILSDLKGLKKTMDYNEYGGAPLMGCAKPVFKAHGSSKAKTFYNALRLTKAYVEGNIISEITESITSMKKENSDVKEGKHETV